MTYVMQSLASTQRHSLRGMRGPVDCIHPKKTILNTAPNVALHRSCGMHRLRRGVPVCPVSTIFALDDLPEKWELIYRTESRKYSGDSPALRPMRADWGAHPFQERAFCFAMQAPACFKSLGRFHHLRQWRASAALPEWDNLNLVCGEPKRFKGVRSPRDRMRRLALDIVL